MSTAASKLAEKILEDRLGYLVRLVQAHPLHKIPSKFKERYSTHLANSDIEKVYEQWRSQSHYTDRYHVGEIIKKNEFTGIRSQILDKINKDITNWMYEHWKKEQN